MAKTNINKNSVIDTSDNGDSTQDVVYTDVLTVKNLSQTSKEIASANDITITEGNIFLITGTTEIRTILQSELREQGVIYLLFESRLTVKHNYGSANGKIHLSGGSDLSVVSGDTLCLVHYAYRPDSIDWYQFGEIINTGSLV